MSDSQNSDDKKSNNIYRLFAVLIVLIVVAVFIQSIYIHRIMKQVKHLSEKQAPIEIVEKTKPSVIVKQKTKTDSSIKKASSSKDEYLSKKLAKLLNSMDFSDDNLFSNNLVSVNATSSKITKTHDKYIVTFLSPGIDKKNISVEAINNVLTVSISKSNLENSNTDTSTSQQQNYSEFTESMLIPSDVNTAKIASKYENGVLTITLPRQAIDSKSTKVIKIE